MPSKMKFNIIPVIDILNSVCVHAKKGQRDKYNPLKTKLINTINPYEFIQELKLTYGFSSFYVADLDAILKKTPNYELLSKITSIPNINIMVDPGIIDINDLKLLINLKLDGIILGLETIKELSVLEKTIELIGSDKVILSVDMIDGRVISSIQEFQGENPLQVINEVKDFELNKIILLDLFRVGQKMGSLSPVYNEIRRKFKGEIYIGGGIKNLEEILTIKEKEFNGVLIATALYDASIDIVKLKSIFSI